MDGRQNICRECERAYYQVNKQKILERQHVYIEAHPEEIKQRGADYYLRNTERVIENVKRYRATPEGKRMSYGVNRRQVEKDPEKRRVRAATNYAIKTGKLIRQPCEVCGATDDIEAHHDSYARKDRLKVRWLCPQHHKDFHMNNL